MVDYFSNENAPAQGNAPVTAAPQVANGEDTGMAEISVSPLLAHEAASCTNPSLSKCNIPHTMISIPYRCCPPLNMISIAGFYSEEFDS